MTGILNDKLVEYDVVFHGATLDGIEVTANWADSGLALNAEEVQALIVVPETNRQIKIALRDHVVSYNKWLDEFNKMVRNQANIQEKIFASMVGSRD